MNSTTPTRVLARTATYTISPSPVGEIALMTAPLVTAWLLALTEAPRPAISAFVTVAALAALAAVARISRGPCLHIVYRGEQLTVDEANITPHMTLPLESGPNGCENFGGPAAVALFESAVAHGAIRVPAHIDVHGYADVDACSVMLCATHGCVSVTTKWLDSARIGVASPEETNDGDRIAAALHYLAGQLNSALHPAH